MTLPSLTTPTADLKLSFSLNADNQLVVDAPFGPSGDLQLVTGINRLIQDIVRWLLTPQGDNPLDPTYGNPLFAELGRPSGDVGSIFVSMVTQAQNYFLVRQQQMAAQGLLALDEQVQAFTDLQVTIGDGSVLTIGQVLVQFTVISRAGTTAQLVAPFSVTLGG